MRLSDNQPFTPPVTNKATRVKYRIYFLRSNPETPHYCLKINSCRYLNAYEYKESVNQWTQKTILNPLIRTHRILKLKHRDSKFLELSF